MQLLPSLNGQLGVVSRMLEFDLNVAFKMGFEVGDENDADEERGARRPCDVDGLDPETFNHSRISAAGFDNRTVIRPAGSRKPAGGDGEARI
jgi:hypothetical protein